MTVMGKENQMILKQRNYRINFKVALYFIFKFTMLFFKNSVVNCLFELLPHPPTPTLYLNRFKNWLWFLVVTCWFS